ncbi:response regulator transcription factor [Sphingobacterium cavernae]|uniref:response regulator transcription factor n=1 Tax=Sphingobacterium cavernae TaxID=2592657 RepID=UPI00122FFFF3|nr:response regulator [Sphingobacterium cavernae]
MIANFMSLFSHQKSTVLLADDNQDILDFIADDLAHIFNIIKTTNGLQALEYVKNNEVDVVVSDIMMPVMNGYELCTTLKENSIFSHIPFIMLTAKNSIQSKIEGLEYGADAYIEKPFSPTFLQAQITSLIRNRQNVKKHYVNINETPFVKSQLNKSDQNFLDRIYRFILENISDPQLCVDMIAEKMSMSRPTLYRKIKSISDLPPNELINIVRLNKSKQLLSEGEFKIYEISNMIGYSNPSHFTRNFHKHYNMSPKDYSDWNKNDHRTR